MPRVVHRGAHLSSANMPQLQVKHVNRLLAKHSALYMCLENSVDLRLLYFSPM